MNTFAYLQKAAQAKGIAMPVLSFPAVHKMGITVQEMLQSSSLMAEAMKLIATETPSPAAVSPMDLSVEAEAFGAHVEFSAMEVPNITGQLVADAKQAEALAIPEIGAGRTGLCLEAMKKAKEIITDRPVFGGVIGPFSLAGRLLDVTEIMYLCYDEPEMVHLVLQKATEFLRAYCLALKQTGLDGLVMAEPLAGLLSAEMCAEFSLPYVKQILDAVQEDSFAVIYHNCGNAVIHMIPDLYELHAAAYHFGNAVSMEEVLKLAPSDMICMGNIDPAGAFARGTAEGMQSAVKALLEKCGDWDNFILSSGCDIPPNAKWENINAFFEAAKNEGNAD